MPTGSTNTHISSGRPYSLQYCWLHGSSHLRWLVMFPERRGSVQHRRGSRIGIDLPVHNEEGTKPQQSSTSNPSLLRRDSLASIGAASRRGSLVSIGGSRRGSLVSQAGTAERRGSRRLSNSSMIGLPAYNTSRRNSTRRPSNMSYDAW